ncbi:MAG: hypothetical protein ABEJ40_04990 [Haloarculaceae archaeon]
MAEPPSFVTDRRGVTPAVGKTLEMGVVVLYVALLTTVLLGGVVPGYRSAAGATVGDRVLAAASQEVEATVPAMARDVTVRRAVDLPAHIAGHGYAVEVDGRSLVLDHPDPAVGGRVRLVLPAHVDRVEGRWQSAGQPVVVVRGDEDGAVVELRSGGRD